MVVAWGLFEKFVLKREFKLKTYSLFLIGLALFSCYQAWLDQYTSAEGRLLANSELNGRIASMDKQIVGVSSERDIWKGKAEQAPTVIHVPGGKNAPTPTEEDGPRRLRAYSVGVLTNYNIDKFKNQGTFIVLTNKTVNPVQVLVTCEKDIDLASVAVLGSSVVFSGGYSGRISNSLKQYAASVTGPIWTPTAPILVTVYAKENPGRCSVEPE